MGKEQDLGSLILAEEAATHLKTRCEKEGIASKDGVYELRFGVAAGGCAGWEYVLEPYEKSREGDSDFFFSDFGVKISVDERSFQFLQGTRIDYQQNVLGSSFVFENPNVQDSCGCGTSFSPKKCC